MEYIKVGEVKPELLQKLVKEKVIYRYSLNTRHRGMKNEESSYNTNLSITLKNGMEIEGCCDDNLVMNGEKVNIVTNDVLNTFL